MPSDVRIRLNKEILNPFLLEKCEESVRRAADRTVERARSKAPHRTGRLRNTIQAWKQSGSGRSVVYRVGPKGLAYGVYQEFGTGPIVPVRKKFLRFVPKGGNTFVFAKRTRGVPAVHYMEQAYNQLSARDYL